MVVDCGVCEASSTRQLWVPDMQVLIAFQLDLHKTQAVQGDLVSYYVVNNHGNKIRYRSTGWEGFLSAKLCETLSG